MKQGLFGEEPYAMVYPVKIDSGFINWSSSDHSQPALQPVAISPGMHHINGRFVDSSESAGFSLHLQAKAGEHYTIKRKIIWDKGVVFSDSAVMVTVWIADSKGNIVSEKQSISPTSHRRNVTVIRR